MPSKLKFVTIGYIEWRKGQDLLVEAVSQLSKELSDQVEFIFIGQNTSLMAQGLSEKVAILENVSMIGTVSREEVHELLENSDMLICPSREDPMPTVCAEAMMHRVPCLLSDVTGTAAYIEDGYDGLVFESENVSDLMDKIIWAINHRDELKEMGERAYEIYEKAFSGEAFEKNLLKHVEEMIGKARG